MREHDLKDSESSATITNWPIPGSLVMATEPARNDPMLTEIQDLKELAAKLIETARKLPPGPERHGILKEIGKFRMRITVRLRAARQGTCRIPCIRLHPSTTGSTSTKLPRSQRQTH